jgi:hypothetical protein
LILSYLNDIEELLTGDKWKPYKNNTI